MTDEPEIRLTGGKLDEIVATGASVHLEQMRANQWFLIVTAGGKSMRVWLSSSRPIKANCEVEND